MLDLACALSSCFDGQARLIGFGHHFRKRRQRGHAERAISDLISQLGRLLHLACRTKPIVGLLFRKTELPSAKIPCRAESKVEVLLVTIKVSKLDEEIGQRAVFTPEDVSQL